MKRLSILALLIVATLLTAAQNPFSPGGLIVKRRAVAGPSDYLTGISIRIVADDVAGVNNDPISTAPDSSGNSLDLTAAGGQRPTLKTASVNGHNSMLFDGSSDFLGRAGVSGGALAQATKVTAFVVLNQDSSQAVNGTFSWDTGASALRCLATFLDVIYFDFPDNVGGRVSGAQPGGWDDAWHILEMWRDGANMEILVDGVSVATRADASGNFDTGGTAELDLGAAVAGLFKGSITEFRIYGDAVSSPNRLTVRQHLQSTYATPALP